MSGQKSNKNRGLSGQLTEQTSLFQVLPVILFTSIVIMVVRMALYVSPMTQFEWTTSTDGQVDFFSYYKMILIIVSSVAAVLMLLYGMWTKTVQIKKSLLYVPMGLYAVLVIFSYLFSDHKDFALLGWVGRLEGTVTLLCYMIMLFYTMTVLQTERAVKWVIHSVALVSVLLSILGIGQAVGADFFATKVGKMLIMPSGYWDQLDAIEFNFVNQIYQTLFNINYVSFYLTLLVPLFGMLFLQEKEKKKKAAWAILFVLVLINMIGAQSSSGLAGLGVTIIIGLILLNKRLLEWKKSVITLVLLAVVVFGVCFPRMLPELQDTVEGLRKDSYAEQEEELFARTKINYVKTKDGSVEINMAEGTILFEFIAENGFLKDVRVVDGSTGQELDVKDYIEEDVFRIEDERFRPYLGFYVDRTDERLVILMANAQWTFQYLLGDEVYFINKPGNLVTLDEVPSIGFEDNLNFGTGRGYIWSRTLPLLKDTLILGYGADTYCIYFPHTDYAGLYNAGYSQNLIVDKPHNMYLGAAVGTGVLSTLCLIAIWGIYVVSSFRLYWRLDYKEDFLSFCGTGIFLGVCGFLVSGMLNDSTVSVMPIFYGLLGTGIAINRMIRHREE